MLLVHIDGDGGGERAGQGKAADGVGRAARRAVGKLAGGGGQADIVFIETGIKGHARDGELKTIIGIHTDRVSAGGNGDVGGGAQGVFFAQRVAASQGDRAAVGQGLVFAEVPAFAVINVVDAGGGVIGGDGKA